MLVCYRRPSVESTHAQQVLCERISVLCKRNNSCCAAYGVNFSDNLYYLFRQLHLSFPDNFFRILRLYLTHYPLISYACVYLIIMQ